MGTFARLSLLSLTISSLENRDVREGIDAAPAYPSPCQLAPPASAQNTATFRRSHWSFIQYSRKPVLHLFFSRCYPFILNTHPHFLSPHILPCFYMPQTHYSSHGRPHSPIRVHPPFPSFAWVMTTQANPPTDAYAYGYVQNAHTQSLPLTQRRTHLPGSCVAHHECYQSNHRTAKPFIPPPPPPSAEVSSIATHEMFMVGPLFFVFFFSTDVLFLSKGWTVGITIRQHGHSYRGERASRHMRCSGYAHRSPPYQLPHLLLVRKGGGVSTCVFFALCVVRVASPKTQSPGRKLMIDSVSTMGNYFTATFSLSLARNCFCLFWFVQFFWLSFSSCAPSHALLLSSCN